MAEKLILAADDDEGWRELLGAWLNSGRYEAVIASRGKDVVPLALKRKPDCFVLDYELGDTLGTDVCLQIRSRPELSGIPIIVLTNIAGEMVKVVKKASPDQFVVKNQDPFELMAVLDLLLAREPS